MPETGKTPSSRRDVSPPNSVKAFAQIKRRDTGASNAKAKTIDSCRRDARLETVSIHSNASKASLGRSHRSRRCSLDDVREDSSQDVCLDYRPPKPASNQEKLYIDFHYLEQFIIEDERNYATTMRQPPSISEVRRQVAKDWVTKPSSKPSPDVKEKEIQVDIFDNFGNLQHNRFTFFSSAWEATIHASRLGNLIMPGESLRDIFTLPEGEAEDGVWWLDMNSPTEEEIRAVCKAFGIHPLTIEDIEKEEPREKIEMFPTYYFASIRSFQMVRPDPDSEVEPDAFSVYVIVFRRGCLSFSFPRNRHAAEVRERMTTLREYVTLSSDWICYALIDNIVDSFAVPINEIELKTESMDDDVFLARKDDVKPFLRQMGDLRQNITGMMRLLGGKADVIRGFTKRCNSAYTITPRIDIGLYLGDIQDHVVTMMSNLYHSEKMLSRSHAMFLAQISIDNIIQTRDTNKVLSRVTMAASVLVPCVMVAGLFGMNVKVPWKQRDDDLNNLHAFAGICGVLVVIVLVCLGIAKRVRWIE